MSKLWAKGYTLDSLVEEFTVGDDYILDVRLIPADILGSLAHAAMLESVHLLSSKQAADLKQGLLQILEEYEQKLFHIDFSDEDGHTAIEKHLVELLGDTGKRIHLGRSRNDQVLSAMRIWMRHAIIALVEGGVQLLGTMLEFARNHAAVPMPGRTHMQPAMPSTAGLWAGGFAEQILDDIQGIFSLYPYFDQCPLGSGAGYGLPLPLDREMTADLLGFSRVQNNVTYSGLCRGKFESRLIDSVEQLAISLSKLASDLILFSLPEFGWFKLPRELCTGSSIMPQKLNPDGLELLRAKAASVSGFSVQVKNIIRSLPSGYNRDYQETKRPTFQAVDTVLLMLKIADLTMSKLLVNREKMLDAFDSGIFATDAAIALTAQGMSFRDAYRKVGENPGQYKAKSPQEAISDRSSVGAAGNPRFDIAENRLRTLSAENAGIRKQIEEAFTKLAGRPISVI